MLQAYHECANNPYQGTNNPDSKVHGANMGHIWGRQDPGWPYVGPMNFATWGGFIFIPAWTNTHISLNV